MEAKSNINPSDYEIGRGCLYYNLVKNKKEVYKNFKWKLINK